ncbi:uncharacterized protein LOC136012721 [Lathamus discolor]|uniref:uncharacterized protein LOC136012721 n=1 Tax=Lathamus discolor TaxID=678569 RepID=UPI0032B73CB6
MDSDDAVTPPGSSVSSRIRQKPVLQAPLREAVGPEGTTMLIKVPFPTLDLETCKKVAKDYRNDPWKQRSSVDKRSYSDLQPTKGCPYVSSGPRTSRPSFLSGNDGEPIHHDCLKTVEDTYSSHPHLKDTPLDDTETWFTDGSSYVISGKRHAGYAITTCREVIESGPLPINTSAQKAEVIALTRALELAKGKNINIYTDSRYVFGVVHAHGAIWKERGLLNSQGKNIKHAQEILRLLEAIQLSEKVAVMHIKVHQKVSSEEGNELADREAKEAAKREVIIEGALISDGNIPLEDPQGKKISNQGGKDRSKYYSQLSQLSKLENKTSGFIILESRRLQRLPGKSHQVIITD